MKECWINGDIVTADYEWYYDFFDMKCTTPEHLKMNFADAKDDEEIIVHVNSGGGMVTAGMEIYSMIAQRKNVTVLIDGIAASAAGVLTQGADKVLIAPVGAIMIHNVLANVNGDYHEMERTAEELQELNRAMAGAYAQKSGRPMDEILELMDKETWLSAEKAISYGFADAIIEPQKAEVTNATGLSLTPEMMAQARAEKDKKEKRMKEIQNMLDFYG